MKNLPLTDPRPFPRCAAEEERKSPSSRSGEGFGVGSRLGWGLSVPLVHHMFYQMVHRMFTRCRKTCAMMNASGRDRAAGSGSHARQMRKAEGLTPALFSFGGWPCIISVCEA